MSLKPYLQIGAVAGALALMICPRVASAQQVDFATCGPTLVQCDDSSNVDGCCYRAFNAVSTDKPIIIPMDRCHQPMASGGTLSPPDSSSPKWCTGSPSGFDDGIFEAYGLVYRLMQNGIPVYWVINPTKDPPALTASQNKNSQTYIPSDIDFWVLSSGATALQSGDSMNSCGSGCTPPVLRLSSSTLSPISGSYSDQEFPVRGGAFVIAAEDRAAFNDLWKRQGAYSSFASDAHYDFSDVDLYEVQNGATFAYQDFTTTAPSYSVPHTGTLPVAVRIDYTPPRVARQSPAGVSAIWLAMAKLDSPADSPACKSGTFTPSDAVYCDITESDIQAGVLVNGNFGWAWIDNWSDNSPCGTTAETTQDQKLDEFMTHQAGVRAGGHVLFMEKAVGVVEGCPNLQYQGLKNSGAGLVTSTSAVSEPLILRYPSSVFMQWGDIPTEFAQGGAASWYYWTNGATGYDPVHTGASGTLMRLVTQDASGSGNALCVDHKSTSSCDIFAQNSTADVLDTATYVRHNSDPEDGIAFYMGGNQVNNNPSQLRMILNALIALPVATVSQGNYTTTEVSRSSPIVATVGGVEAQYQGTYELYDPPPAVPTYTGTISDSTFEFPYTLGHLRAVDASQISSTDTAFDQLGGVIFDAADGIPPADPAGCASTFAYGCRTVFTNITDGQKPDRILLTTGNVAQLKPLMAPTLTDTEAETLISRVLAGRKDSNGNYEPKLGGVDRSTMAVIESSPMAGKVRPTMIYVGALDGMIHAFCAEVLGPCQAKGQELWAYLPRNQLPRVSTNTQRIDGSPKVADVFADFDNSGTKTWRTILTFQTGSGDPGFADREPSVIALDVTAPEDPQILWEVKTPATRGNFELGVGIGLAMGPIRVGSDLIHATFVATNNGGTAGPGIRVQAYNSATGEALWSQPFEYLYPSPRDSTNNPPVPATGIPGGVAAFDRTSSDSITDIAVTTLYGQLFVLDATDGTSRFGTDTPLFSFDSDFHPIGASPTIFVDQSTGKYAALVVSGGYADPVNSSWAPDTVEQFAVAVDLDAPQSVAPMGDTGTDYGGERLFVISLGVGQRAYSQAVIAGNELFVTTDSGDVNASTYGSSTGTGQLTRYKLDGSSSPVYITGIGGGASSADVTATGVAHIGAGDSARKVDFSSDFNSSGQGVELSWEATSKRKLWLRIQ